jgi:predicted metalloprotease with PDZ domain
MRGKERVTFVVERNGQEREIAVDVPRERNLMKRRGVHVSGMIVGQAVTEEAKPSKMYIHFIDDASDADQAQFNPGDQVTSIDGIITDSYETILTALKARNGQTAKFVIRRLRQPVQGSGSYDYLVRKLEVKDLYEVTESGIKP